MIWFAHEQAVREFPAMFEKCSLAANDVLIGVHLSMYARIFLGTCSSNYAQIRARTIP
jgi:hypothetical protein